MPWYAIDAVTDAIDEAKALLLPFDLRRWLVLAVITFFVGGGTSGPSLNQSFDAPTQGGELPDVPVDADVWVLVAAILVVLLLVGVVFLVVGSVMEFVFVDALRSRDVRIRGRFGRRLGPGIRLVGFRLLLLAVGLLVLGLVAIPIYTGVVLGSPIALLALIVTLPVAILLGISLAVVQEFTTAFVVPLVCDTEGGILATWRDTLWPAVRREWQQFLLYAVLKWGISIGIGLAVGIALSLVFLPVVLLVGAGLLAGALSPAIVAVGGLLALFLFLLTLVFVQMPIAVALRYYSLLVLGMSEIEWTLRDGDEEAASGEATT